jgi:hypothetical protein
LARYAGRKGRLYAGLASDSATAEPVAFLKSWSLDMSTDKIDVTALGDTNKVTVAGLPNASGDYAGFWDNATSQLFNAAVDGLARKFYLYPTTEVPTKYIWGTAFFDASLSTDVGGAVEISGSYEAASSVGLVGF